MRQHTPLDDAVHEYRFGAVEHAGAAPDRVVGIGTDFTAKVGFPLSPLGGRAGGLSSREARSF